MSFIPPFQHKLLFFEIVFALTIIMDIRNGHGCIGCTSPNFWDTRSPFYQPAKSE